MREQQTKSLSIQANLERLIYAGKTCCIH